MWRKMEDEKKQLKGKTQAKIDSLLEIQPKPNPKQFTHDGALQAIVQFVACDDQVQQLNVVVVVTSYWWFQ